VDFVRRGENNNRFKIHVDFGVIKEVMEEDENGRTRYSYKQLHPVEQNLQRVVPIVIHNDASVAKYKDYLKSQLIKYQNYTAGSTKEMIIAFRSMMVVAYRMSPNGTGSKERVKKYCVKQLARDIISPNNLCFWPCMALRNMFENRTKDEERFQDLCIVHKGRELFREYYGEDNKNYEGLYLDEIPDVAEHFKMNIFVYECDEDEKYKLSSELSSVDEARQKQLHVLYISNEDEAHYLYVCNNEKLTNSKICPICFSAWFDMSDKTNWKKNYNNHLAKCKEGGGKIKKRIKLDKITMPFAPHMTQSKTHTTDFITYDFETCEIRVGKSFGKKSELVSKLEPITVAVCVSNGGKQESKCFSIRKSENFVSDMIEYIFEKAQDIPTDTDDKRRNYVNVIGFNSAKFDFVLLLPYLQSQDWEIDVNSFIGTASLCKQVIVKHKRYEKKLRFLDLLLYAPNNDLRKMVQIFGEGANLEKGLFPYDLLSVEKKETLVEELNLILDKTEYFTQNDLNNALTNSKISDKDYATYLQDSKNYKNRWDYLEFYNVRDVEVMITPIKNMIKMLYEKMNIDMLSYLSPPPTPTQ
jgi:hypothetical protein